MENSKEVAVLFSLLDDPDEEVFAAVSKKLIGYGKNVIPDLEHLWETLPDEETQKRIIQIIHQVNYNDIAQELKNWALSNKDDLLAGILLVAKFQNPFVSISKLVQEIDLIKQSIWLELNDYLTPLEKLKVFITIFYRYFTDKSEQEGKKSFAHSFFIENVLLGKKGAELNIAILMRIIADALNLPLQLLSLNDKLYLVYVNPENSLESEFSENSFIDYYSEIMSETIFTQDQIMDKLCPTKKIINAPFTPSDALSNASLIHSLLQELGTYYRQKEKYSKMMELRDLANLLL